jgi:Fe-S oxidoreductase
MAVTRAHAYRHLMLTTLLGTFSLVLTAVALALFGVAVSGMLRVIRLGQPDPTRSGARGRRALTLVRETLGHTRMNQWTLQGISHWFVFVGFGALFTTLVHAYIQVFSPESALPIIGGWLPYEFLVDTIGFLTGVGIITLILIRQITNRTKPGRASRFFGSTTWQAYFVEAIILLIVVCVFLLRGMEGALHGETGISAHYLFTGPMVALFAGASESSLLMGIQIVAAIKIVISMAWFIVIARNLTMGVAWHRFSAFFNVFFKRHDDGTPSLGELPPMMSKGAPVNFEDPADDDVFGYGKVEDMSWKGLLDLTTCTECGRCQSQCPAWNTEKPLSPKLLITALRDHAYAKAPYLLAGDDADEAAKAEAGRTLVAADGVITPDVLWSCTTCGACVQQCPVDIEHIDHIVNMRRNQVLIESEFPTELGGLFRNLENKGNPWGMNASSRNDWITEVDFEVTVLEGAIPDDVEYLFWVGCAGAFEDRAKKTTKAVAELLHQAGVTFGVLGEGETCTGDPARRAGNEFLYQMLAQQNIEVLGEVFGERTSKKVVVTCPHCFTTLGRDYSQLGIELEVIHHTQLLNRLVRDRKLVPIKPVEQKITYHDPCYLGRHNGVYTPPRELLEASGVELREMPRTESRSFCCGAGGARMWMEERIGSRINLARVDEALATGAEGVAVACPFCRVMVSDGVTTRQQEGSADPGVEVLDVAQMLLKSVRG